MILTRIFLNSKLRIWNEQLLKIFGVPQNLFPPLFSNYQLLFLGVLIRNWSNEKFIEGGTICFPGIGTMIDLASIRKSHGPVHFAGTEVSAKFTGTNFFIF